MKKPLKPLLWVLILVMCLSLVSVFSSGGCRRAAPPVEESVIEEPVEGPAEEVVGEQPREEPSEDEQSIAFIGTWVNEDEGTGGITRIVIRAEFDTIFVHMWGKCHPTDCDWGEETTNIADANDNRLSLEWNPGFVIVTQVIYYLDDGRLKVDSHSHYIDDSGRPDSDYTYYFAKCSDLRSIFVSDRVELELLKDYSLFISEVTQADYSVNGIVEEISGRNLTITEFTDNEEIEEASSLVVQVSQDAEIIANYILYIFPEGTSEEEIDEYIEEYLKRQISEKKTGEEITGRMSGPNGEICYLGEKEISVSEITIGDVVFIVLDSKSGSGTYVEVWPVDFFDHPINRVNFNGIK